MGEIFNYLNSFPSITKQVIDDEIKNNSMFSENDVEMIKNMIVSLLLSAYREGYSDGKIDEYKRQNAINEDILYGNFGGRI